MTATNLQSLEKSLEDIHLTKILMYDALFGQGIRRRGKEEVRSLFIRSTLRVMHNSVQYDPIQGQRQRHQPFKVGNLAIFKSYLLCNLQWELATDHGFLN